MCERAKGQEQPHGLEGGAGGGRWDSAVGHGEVLLWVRWWPRAQAVRAVDSRLCIPDTGQRWLYKSAREMAYSAGGAGTTGYPMGWGAGKG